MLGAQQARADRAARRALMAGHPIEGLDLPTEEAKAPGLGVDPQDQHIRTRAIELAQGAVALGIVEKSEVVATAQTYYDFIIGGKNG